MKSRKRVQQQTKNKINEAIAPVERDEEREEAKEEIEEAKEEREEEKKTKKNTQDNRQKASSSFTEACHYSAGESTHESGLLSSHKQTFFPRALDSLSPSHCFTLTQATPRLRQIHELITHWGRERKKSAISCMRLEETESFLSLRAGHRPKNTIIR